jgi:hypothetical protein
MLAPIQNNSDDATNLLFTHVFFGVFLFYMSELLYNTTIILMKACHTSEIRHHVNHGCPFPQSKIKPKLDKNKGGVAKKKSADSWG